MNNLNNFFNSILYFKWTVSLLKWMILVAGTVSECAFLIASIYLCLNASVHSLVLTILSEQSTVHLAELSTAIFIALPECIVFLAVVKTLSHWQTYRYTKDKTALLWTILFGIPTVNFALLTVVTISNAVLQVGFELPPVLVVTRALSAYFFAFIAMLYTQIGQPQEVNRLQEKDQLILDMAKKIDEEREKFAEEKASLLEKFSVQKTEMENLKLLFYEEKMKSKKLFSEIKNAEEAALEALPQELSILAKSKKSCSIEEANSVSGISKTRICNAVKRGEIKVSSRNKELLVVSSLVEWIKNQPVLLQEIS